MRTWEEIREDFPILKEKIHGKDLIYLDNAATTQLPQQVLDCFVEHYTKYNANVHRGIHYLSEQSTMHMEAVRDRLKAFLHAEAQGEIIFTSGATDSANLVAQSFLRHALQPGDVVLSTELEHHANFVVWQQVCQECGADFRMIPTVDGELDMNAAHKMLSDKVKLLAVTAVSNVTGTVVDIETLIAWAKEYEIPVYIDAAPTGVGCLFVREKWLNEMQPYRYGGGMIDIVTEEKTTFAELPARLEAGTPNYSGIITWGAALDYLMDIGIERMASYEEELLKKAEEVLAAIPQVNILGHPKQRAGCISIQIDGVHPYDFASMIDKYGVAVRTGSMCAQPIVNKMGLDTVIRISPAFYNTMEEMEKLGEYTEKVIAFFERIKR